ncbi:hypothetical protein FB451DRAFT_1566862 [Mycena latifolia]|nr:hypothetical protein FB451DRAFT_1566862 [Mycena latifolia]
MGDDTMDATYGAMFIGVLFATFFQGVLTLQAYIYYEAFPDDPVGVKALVAGVWILDVAHLVLISQTCYHYLITSWGNNAALLVSTQPGDLHLILVGIATAVCQGFFLLRIWSFSKKNWALIGILGAACLATLGLETAMSVQMSQMASVAAYSSLTSEAVAVFCLSVAGEFLPLSIRTSNLHPEVAVDVAIALIMIWYLRAGETSFNRTTFVIARLIQYTVATGLATSALAVGCLIAYLTRPHTFIFIAMHFSLGRMYTNALLATLNSRRNLRKVLEGTMLPNSGSSFLAPLQTAKHNSSNEEYMLEGSRKGAPSMPN